MGRMEWFKDSYKVVIELQDETGQKRVETHREMSLSDFEEVYGQITEHIIQLEMRLENGCNIRNNYKCE